MPSTASAPREPGDAILVKRVCEREDANRTRESRRFAANRKAGNKIDALEGAYAGTRDEVEGIVARFIGVISSGAVGFVEWFDSLISCRSAASRFGKLHG